MQKLIITILLGATSLFVHASEYKLNVKCVTVEQLDVLMYTYRELPFIRGTSVRGAGNDEATSPFVFFLNAKTGSWTYTERVSNNEYCIFASGGNFEPVPADLVNKSHERRKGT